MKNRLTTSIVRGMEHMMNNFDEDSGGLPWFDVRLRKERPAYAEHFPGLDEAHVPGRCLDGLLFGESITGRPVPDSVIETFRRFLFASFDPNDCLNGFNTAGRRTIGFHNLREGLFGLNALIKWREDGEAAVLAEKMVASLASMVDSDGDWKRSKLEQLSKTVELHCGDSPVQTSGRLVGALVEYHETTGSEQAFELSRRLAGHTLRTCFHEDGSLTEKAGRHVHSITSSLSSLAACFAHTGGTAELDRLRRVFDHGLSDLRSSFGWVKELVGPEEPVGEVNSTGDLIQAALVFARSGWPQYFAEAERMIRGHLLPAQVWDRRCIDKRWCVEADDADGSKWRDVGRKLRGGFGFPSPNDRAIPHYDNDYVRITTLDITAGAVQALCRSWCEAVAADESGGINVDLLFDRYTGPVAMAQSADAPGHFSFEVSRPVSLSVRIPEPVNREGIRVEAAGDVNSQIGQNRVRIRPDGQAGPYRLEIEFPLKRHKKKERLCGREYVTIWQGEQVVSIEPGGTISPMFHPYPVSHHDASETVMSRDR